MSRRGDLALVLALLSSPVAHANLESLTLSSDDKIPSLRVYDAIPKSQKEKNPTVLQLAAVKAAQMEGNYESCVSKANSVRGSAKSLQSWLAVTEIDCATKAKKTTANANKLAQALTRASGNSSWLLKGPQASLLRGAMIEGYLTLIEQDVKSNRARAWKSIDAIQELLAYSDKTERARLWRLAGDLAFLQQKSEAARDFMRRSLGEQDSDETRQRLASIENAIGTPKAATPAPKPSDAPAPVAEASKDELELVDRVTLAMKQGELVPAVEDSLKIINNYPGSHRAKWAADRALDAYLSMIDKTDSKYIMLRERILKLMEKGDADRMSEWARSMYGRGQYADSYTLAKRALGHLTGARRTPILDLAAKAALGSDQFSEARDYSTELVNNHAGTKESREAMVRLGLLNYRSKQYPEALANFERVTALPNNETLELLARYWSWRSLQKMNSDRAAAAADELMKRFPFSYYGLRARYELASGTLEWKVDTKKKTESKIWLTSAERLAWERTQLLLRAGWLEEAQAELRLLPAPMKADDKAVRALLWAAAGQYQTASKLVNEAWDEKGELRNMPFVAAAFPSEFDNWITEQAKERSLDRYLVKSLIKQESSYNARAISSSNALGLMQVIPPTAKEIANDLRIGALDIPNDLFQPKKNIQLGTYYLAKLLTKYQGTVPLALAAYNAGPGRMDRWLRARPSLKGLVAMKTSAPDDELWFDEIPYAETSFYVKAILRNLLIYKMLDQGRVQVKDPLWSFE